MNGGFWGFLEDEAETTADVNFGKVFAIAMFADAEAWEVFCSANSSSKLLSNNLSKDKEEDKRAFL